MKYPARFIYETNREQSMKEHSVNVSKICRESMAHIGLGCLGELTGIIHDAGKLKKSFIEYMGKNDKSLRGSISHSDAGAEYLYHSFYKCTLDPVEKLTAQLIINSVYCHHGRLYDCITPEGENKFEKKMKNHSDCGYKEIMNVFFNEILSEGDIQNLFYKSCEEMKKVLPTVSSFNFFGLGMIQKLLYSSLIDADRYDAFCFETEYKSDYLKEIPQWKNAADNMEMTISKFKSADTEIDKMRCMISDKCFEAANRGEGLYTLSVPTGSGKTLSSLRFALNFAKKNNKKHIFYVIPYTTILDQTASEVRKICGDDMVLEHHSGIVFEDDDKLQTYQLLTQRWNSPIILTTIVQFMNALYSGKSACARRMNSLCNSVIIIDEVQFVPRRLIHLFTEAINFLHEVCKSTVLLCTATQPDFGSLENHPLRLNRDSDLAAGIPELNDVFKRNEVVNLYSNRGMTFQEITDLAEKQLKDKNSVLIIMNKIGEAKTIYDLINCGCEKIYISSKKCGAQRKELIEYIKNRTSEIAAVEVDVSEKLIIVSTQMVEAGVDFSCGCVIRAAAGVDSIAQAAGRCNRNGEINELCKVFMVNVEDEDLSRLEDIRRAKRCTEALLSRDRDIDLLSKEAVKKYYSEYLKNESSNLDDKDYIVGNTTMMEMLSENTKYVTEYVGVNGFEELPSVVQSFETAGKMFRVIDNNTYTVVVPYKDGKKYLKTLNGSADICTKYDVIRKCSKYSVNLYQYEIDKLKERNALYFIEDVGVWALAEGFYSEEYGVVPDGDQELLEF